jgi:hypothetical protein
VFSLTSLSGYRSFYTHLKRYLHSQHFAEHIVIVGKQDFGRTGNFEVWVGETLVHSNKTRRDGYANRTKDREVICEAIEIALKEQNMQ